MIFIFNKDFKTNLLGQQLDELEERFLEYQYSAEDEEDPSLILQFSSQQMVPFCHHLCRKKLKNYNFILKMIINVFFYSEIEVWQ